MKYLKGMKGIFKNIGSEIITLHPTKKDLYGGSYDKSGLVPGQVVRIDIDEVKGLLQQYIDELNGGFANSDAPKGTDKMRWAGYMDTEIYTIKRWIIEHHENDVYCMLKKVDNPDQYACPRCALMGICKYFPSCMSSNRPRPYTIYYSQKGQE